MHESVTAGTVQPYFIFIHSSIYHFIIQQVSLFQLIWSDPDEQFHKLQVMQRQRAH